MQYRFHLCIDRISWHDIVHSTVNNLHDLKLSNNNSETGNVTNIVQNMYELIGT